MKKIAFLLAAVVLVLAGCGETTRQKPITQIPISTSELTPESIVTTAMTTTTPIINTTVDTTPKLEPIFAPEREEGKIYFRDSTWGMSEEHIVEIEGIPDNISNTLEGTSAYTYDDIEVSGYKASILYNFNKEGKLFHAVYRIETSSELVFDDYGILRQLLTELYGEHDDEKTVWHKGLNMLDAVWTRDNTSVELSLSSTLTSQSLSIGYYDVIMRAEHKGEPLPTTTPHRDGNGL